MYDPVTIAYVGCSLLVIILFIAVRFTYRLYYSCSYFTVRFHGHGFKIYCYLVASLFLLSYFAVAVTLIVLTAVHRPRCAEWSWRWSVGGALLDSICAISSTREWSRYPRVAYLQCVLALIEAILVLVPPAIPIPDVSKYANLGAIMLHSMWTAISTWSWTCGRRRAFRWIASAGQAIGAVVSVWSPLAFVVIFFIFSIIICVEELNASQELFWRIGSSREQTNQDVELEKIYNVVFFGKCPQRTDSLRRVTSWSLPDTQIGGVDIFQHPTLKEFKLASVPPDVSLSLADKGTYIRRFMKAAAAIVLVLDVFDDESWAYIEHLEGFSEGQPVLLVACNLLHDDWRMLADRARDYAHGRGWDFTILHDVESAFTNLVRKMRARPPSRVQSPGIVRSRFEV